MQNQKKVKSMNEEIKFTKDAKNIKTGVSVAVFAGGCFWCMEPPFEKAKGVKAAISGYAGATEELPTYESVSSGSTKYVESILIEYNETEISYKELLDIFWRNIDPTQRDGQFYDRGPQYKSYVYYLNEEQKHIAEISKDELAKSGKFKNPIATQIAPVYRFWKAEEYHQDYYKKNPTHYYGYRKGSGRDGFIEKTWGSK